MTKEKIREKNIKRVCAGCGQVKYFSKRSALSRICVSCTQKKKAEETIKRQKLAIESFGYVIIGKPIQDNHRKYRYTVRNRECGHEFQMVFGNLQNGIKKALAKGIENIATSSRLWMRKLSKKSRLGDSFSFW